MASEDRNVRSQVVLVMVLSPILDDLLCSIRCFDNKIFRITDEEARYMDVQQKMVLEVSYKALEEAGMSLDEVKGTDTAVFIG